MTKKVTTVHDLVLQKCQLVLRWLFNGVCLHLRSWTKENKCYCYGSECLQISVRRRRTRTLTSIVATQFICIMILGGGFMFPFYRWGKQVTKWLSGYQGQQGVKVRITIKGEKSDLIKKVPRQILCQAVPAARSARTNSDLAGGARNLQKISIFVADGASC